MPARLAASRQAYQTTLSVIGVSAVCQRPPGNSQTAGLRGQTAIVLPQFVEQIRAEHDVAILAALAALDVDTMRWMSMSVILRLASSARRTPVA